MTMYLAKNGLGLTVEDVVLLELPHVPRDAWEDILWEFTGWPCFFATSPADPQPIHVLRRQLREFRDGTGP